MSCRYSSWIAHRISFFTFQAISYLWTCTARTGAGAKIHSARVTYYFPHSWRPHCQFKTIVQDLHDKQLSLSRFNLGAKYLVVGLGKKR